MLDCEDDHIKAVVLFSTHPSYGSSIRFEKDQHGCLLRGKGLVSCLGFAFVFGVRTDHSLALLQDYTTTLTNELFLRKKLSSCELCSTRQSRDGANPGLPQPTAARALFTRSTFPLPGIVLLRTEPTDCRADARRSLVKLQAQQKKAKIPPPTWEQLPLFTCDYIILKRLKETFEESGLHGVLSSLGVEGGIKGLRLIFPSSDECQR